MESCKAYKIILLVVENGILIRYYLQTPKTRAGLVSIDGPSGQPAGNPAYSDGLGVYL
jgi:hypothetical protein